MIKLLAGAAIALVTSCFGIVGGATAGPVEYVKVCSTFGAGFEYLPGTDTCVNVNTGATMRATENGPVAGKTVLANRIDQAFDAIDKMNEGSAVAGALPTPIIDAGHNFAIAGDWTQLESKGAFGLAGAIRFNQNLSFNGGVAVGADQGTVAGRVGFNLSW